MTCLLRLATFALLLAACAVLRAAPPNVVVILTDDQGWGDLSVHGNANLETPHVDSLARDGALFERFYVCPVCAPTRAEFLTGRYHPRGGVHGVSTGLERLNTDERTIAQVFHDAGYATAAFGKWHNGTQFPYHPNARGFDEYYGFTSGHWGHYFSPLLDHNGELVHGRGYLVDDFTDRALDFIAQHRDRPFFCYLPYNTPHSPFHVPYENYGKFAEHPLPQRHRDPEREELLKTRAALAMCENIDQNVGRILQTLDDLQLAENTIVVYFTDNGPNTWRWNGEMKGRKGSTDEGGVRVPCLIRWPGHIPAGTRIGSLGAAIDLLPTLADLAGIDIGATKPLDGISLAPLLTGEQEAIPDRRIFSRWGNRVSVRTDRFRLDHQGRLFDLIADPRQDHDITDDHPDEVRELRAAVRAWKLDVGLTQPPEPRPYPVGFPGAPNTQLPARDGEPHGNVQRSARAPNCSYMTHWTSTDDRITWDVDVLEAGRYEVTLHYTCTPENVGSTVSLSLGDAALTFQVTEPHDPPLRGSEADRADRGSESYVKNFRPWRVGTLELPQGRGLLTLQATDVAGGEVMDVRMLVLRRVD